MKTDRIINTELIEAVAAIGHTQSLVIADAGLPVPKGVRCIDLSVVRGTPSFACVLKAVASELVVEKVIFAEEAKLHNAQVTGLLVETFPQAAFEAVSHEHFKELTKDAMVIVRTGECTSYANAILIGGVNF